MAVLERILDIEKAENLLFEGRAVRITSSEYSNGITRFDIRARNEDMQTRGLALLGYSQLDFRLQDLEGKNVKISSLVKRNGKIDLWQHLQCGDSLDIRQHVEYTPDFEYKVSGRIRQAAGAIVFESNYSFSFRKEEVQ